MNLGNVMDELGTALKTIADLRVFDYFATNITPPAATVSWPDSYDFDTTMGRGMDTVDFFITILVSAVNTRTSKDLLAKYTDGSGTSSVKQKLEAFTYTTCDSVRVVSVRFDVVAMSGVDYLAGTFRVNVVGKGV